MGHYRFFSVYAGQRRLADAASLPNDEIALLHAYGFMRRQACIDVWDDTRHVACLWGETPPLGIYTVFVRR
jgi:1,2-phenylacetyl-CoA epoxidase PaaB subunit